MERYLGDGLYASFDGFQVKLRAPVLGGNQVVYIDEEVQRNLIEYFKDIGVGKVTPTSS